MLNEGPGYAHGNLGRDWERKEVTAQGEQKVIWTSSVAYQPKKTDETVWIDLTVWPDRSGSDAFGTLLATDTHKGTPVLVWGALKRSPYTTKEGGNRTGWKMSVYKVGTEVRPPWTGDNNGSGDAVVSAFPGAKFTEQEMEPF